MSSPHPLRTAMRNNNTVKWSIISKGKMTTSKCRHEHSHTNNFNTCSETHYPVSLVIRKWGVLLEDLEEPSVATNKDMFLVYHIGDKDCRVFTVLSFTAYLYLEISIIMECSPSCIDVPIYFTIVFPLHRCNVSHDFDSRQVVRFLLYLCHQPYY